MKVLELFCGTGSVSKICDNLGWECISVDINDKLFYKELDYKIDILKLDYQKEFEIGEFDIIWASPPCASFSSMLNIHKHIDIQKRMAEEGLPLLYKARQIIDYLKPKYYFIENPKTGRMKNFINDLPFYDVCYCRYGFTYKKPTRIWTNLENFNALYCNHKGKHEDAIGMTRTGEKKIHPIYKGRKNKNYCNNLKLYEKYSIPAELIEKLFLTIINSS